MTVPGSIYAAVGETKAMTVAAYLPVELRPDRMHLARNAGHHVVRGDDITRSMSDYLVKEIEANAAISIRLGTEVIDGRGYKKLEGLTLRDRVGTVEEVDADALFLLIGAEPHTEWLPSEVARDGHGYVLTGRDVSGAGRSRPAADVQPLPLETSVPGVRGG